MPHKIENVKKLFLIKQEMPWLFPLIPIFQFLFYNSLGIDKQDTYFELELEEKNYIHYFVLALLCYMLFWTLELEENEVVSSW